MGLAAVLGDAGTLEKLKALQERLEEHLDLYTSKARRLNYPIRMLESRLALPQGQQARRQQNELLFWQACNEGSELRHYQNIEIRYFVIPPRLAHRGLTIDADFLLEQLEYAASMRMPVALFASQHNPQLIVRQFDPLTKEPSPEAVRKQARRVLSELSSSPVLRVVEGCLTPEADNRVNREIAHYLSERGNRISLDRLNRLASDERFSADDREHFRQAAMQIRRRLDM